MDISSGSDQDNISEKEQDMKSIYKKQDNFFSEQFRQNLDSYKQTYKESVQVYEDYYQITSSIEKLFAQQNIVQTCQIEKLKEIRSKLKNNLQRGQNLSSKLYKKIRKIYNKQLDNTTISQTNMNQIKQKEKNLIRDQLKRKHGQITLDTLDGEQEQQEKCQNQTNSSDNVESPKLFKKLKFEDNKLENKEEIENDYLNLNIPKLCYVCKQKYKKLHFFYDQLCYYCGLLNYKKRSLTADLTGKIALVTGGRVKIGYQLVKTLLQNNCSLVIVTTRFPNDAMLRFSQEPDFSLYKDKLKFYGLDFRDLNQLYQFCKYLNKTLPKLDILINNAAQTLRRDPQYFQHLMGLENQDIKQLQNLTQLKENQIRNLIPDDFEYNKMAQQNIMKKFIQQSKQQPIKVLSNQQIQDLYRNTEQHNNILKNQQSQDNFQQNEQLIEENLDMKELQLNKKLSSFSDKYYECRKNQQEFQLQAISEDNLKENTQNVAYSALLSQIPVLESDFLPVEDKNKFLPPKILDINNQQVDLSQQNSWINNIQQVDFKEFMEVQIINQWAPYILIQNLKSLMEKNNPGFKEKRFIQNVSSMEGKFNRVKQTYHPHTNMSKAGLNMLTKTCGKEFYASNIFMNSADTGWVSEMNPNSQNIHRTVPLDELDGAMRVLDNIFTGLNGGKIEHSLFYKDYKISDW